MCLAVVEKQNLNLSVIYKEMVANLNIKGKELLNGYEQILVNSKSLEEFMEYSIFIDKSRERFFCQDAFELCLNIEKGYFLYKLAKKNLKVN